MLLFQLEYLLNTAVLAAADDSTELTMLIVRRRTPVSLARTKTSDSSILAVEIIAVTGSLGSEIIVRWQVQRPCRKFGPATNYGAFRTTYLEVSWRLNSWSSGRTCAVVISRARLCKYFSTHARCRHSHITSRCLSLAIKCCCCSHLLVVQRGPTRN